MAASGIILAFHQSSDRHYPGVNNLKPGYFYAMLNLLKDWGFEFWNGQVPFADATKCGLTVITFDDGYEANYDLLTVLCRDGIRPIVFVPSGFIGHLNSWDYSSWAFPARHLSADQIKHLSDLGAIFGSHGVSHRSLTAMPPSNARRELNESKKEIEVTSGTTVDLLSFPFGRYNIELSQIAQELGYRHGLIIRDDFAGDEKDAFILPRVAIYGFDDFYSLRLKLCKISALEHMKSGIIGRLAGGTIVLKSPLK